MLAPPPCPTPPSHTPPLVTLGCDGHSEELDRVGHLVFDPPTLI